MRGSLKSSNPSDPEKDTENISGESCGQVCDAFCYDMWCKDRKEKQLEKEKRQREITSEKKQCKNKSYDERTNPNPHSISQSKDCKDNCNLKILPCCPESNFGPGGTGCCNTTGCCPDGRLCCDSHGGCGVWQVVWYVSLVVIMSCVWCCCCRKKKKQEEKDEQIMDHENDELTMNGTIGYANGTIGYALDPSNALVDKKLLLLKLDEYQKCFQALYKNGTTNYNRPGFSEAGTHEDLPTGVVNLLLDEVRSGTISNEMPPPNWEHHRFFPGFAEHACWAGSRALLHAMLKALAEESGAGGAKIHKIIALGSAADFSESCKSVPDFLAKLSMRGVTAARGAELSICGSDIQQAAFEAGGTDSGDNFQAFYGATNGNISTDSAIAAVDPAIALVSAAQRECTNINTSTIASSIFPGRQNGAIDMSLMPPPPPPVFSQDISLMPPHEQVLFVD